MALIKCPECGKEISDKAEECPECGYPLAQKKTKKVFDFLHNLSLKKRIGLIIFGIVCLGIVIFGLFFSIIGIEDYSVISTINNISDGNIKINECKTYYYSPQVMNTIYEDTGIDKENIIVFCDIRTKEGADDIEDNQYVYVYDMDGNIITYFKMDDNINDAYDLNVHSFLVDSEDLDWYGWNDYSTKDIDKLLDKNIDGKKIILTIPSKKESEDVDNLLEQYIELELDNKECALAESHIDKLNDKKSKEKYTQMLAATYYDMGLIAYEQGEYENALNILKNASNYNGTKDLIDKINQAIEENDLEEAYQQAIKDANNHKYEDAKAFFEQHKDYQDSQEFLDLINIAEQSKWEGYWVADDLDKAGSDSHIRILATVFSYDPDVSDIKGTGHSITMSESWDFLEMPYFQENFGFGWREENNQLILSATEDESMRIDGEKLIWTQDDGTELSYHRDEALKE